MKELTELLAYAFELGLDKKIDSLYINLLRYP